MRTATDLVVLVGLLNHVQQKMKCLLLVIAVVGCLAATGKTQGLLATLYHLVRVDYLLEDERALKFARPVNMSLPRYDFELIRAGIEGSATVRFIIDKEGRVGDLVVTQQSQREFSQEAEIELLRKAKQ